MRSVRVWFLAALLSIMGLSIMLYKHLVLEFPLSPHNTYNSWYLEARVDVTSRNPWRAGDKPLLITMQLPHPSDKFVVVDENIVASGFGHETSTADDGENRVSVFSKRKIDARETIFYRATIYELDSPAARKVKEPKAPNSPYAKNNRPKLSDGEKEAPVFVAVDSLIDEAREKSASDKTFVREIYKLSRSETDDRVKLIRDTVNVSMAPAELAALLLEAAAIPTRTAHGLKLSADMRKAPFVKWLEVYTGKKWLAIDPEEHRFGLDEKYVVWWYGDAPFFSAEGNVRAEPSVSVRRITNDALTRAIWKSGQLADILLTFSFYNLPIDSQIVFQVLLLIPVGGLMLAFLRQVVGIKTFGTFMPVLIALAFRETGLVSGIVLFVVVVAFGLLIRNYFDHLKLLLVPRLASVLTVVVILLSFIAMITHQMGITLGLSLALFPIVILTMTIERMTLMWEEYGPQKAINTGTQSLFAAVLAYFAMNSEALNHLIFSFPELLLVVLALTLLLGRYNHYKLTEYIRFRQLQRSLAELEKRESEKVK